MSKDETRALLAFADEIEALKPIPSTFNGLTALGAARMTLRMCAELARDRANGDTSRDRDATEAELAEVRDHG